jgi:hypothetical protein
MTAVQSTQFANGSNSVDELYLEATADALNAELVRRDISTEQVIAILPVAAQIMIDPTPPRFRVPYRMRTP